MLGLLMLCFTMLLARWRPARKASSPDARTRRPGALAAFALGLVMWLPSPTFLAALKQISDIGASPAMTALYAAVAVVLVLWILEIPIIAYLVSPATAKRRLTTLSIWAHEHGHTLLMVLTGGTGILLIVDGIVGLLG